ncbi:hypothetical protein [Sagittula sp. SSi028]|uniref:hypothetical protein n=1 Tax=Sagittula sp. SSi028 TaxID=3400636 RepID=UPI003AF6249F
MRIWLFVFAILAACGRPLTEAETAYLGAIHGDALDTSRMRLVDGHFAGEFTYTLPVRPRTTCQERLWPALQQDTEVTVAPAATVLFNKVLLRQDLFREDMLAGFPEQIDLYDAMLLAHEATHVWQWQNRARTGYHPLKALREHVTTKDPYLFDPDSAGRFLDYGYEQQGTIVEEYVCCRLLDPDAPRTERLRAMISAEMPLDRLDQMIDGPRVTLPWAGAQTEGICSASYSG